MSQGLRTVGPLCHNGPMTTTEAPFRVHCSHCGTMIHSDSPAIFDDRYPFCAMCEFVALMNDLDFALVMEEAPVLTPDDEEWWA